jgi:hypothetical protein
METNNLDEGLRAAPGLVEFDPASITAGATYVEYKSHIKYFKQRKEMIKKLIILSVVLLVAFQVKAYDFYVTNKDNVRIYYDFQGGAGNKVMVAEGSQAYTYSGIVHVPDSVLYDGTTYAVETVGSRAFFYCGELTEVILPPKLTTIRESAFSGCVKLTGINLPDGLITIRERAFEGCTALKTVTSGSNLTTIGQYAFADCSNLESIDLGDKISTIEEMTFSGCSSLKKITLPEKPYRD